MALEDTVNDELDSSSVGEDEEEGESTEEESDRLFDESFGAGKFVPNEYGGRTFIPAQVAQSPQLTPQQAAQPSPFTNPAAIDSRTMLPMGGGQRPQFGRQQIRSLQQLAAVAKKLKGLPPEWQKRVLAHLMGTPYQDPQQATLSRMMQLAQYRQQLGQPQREAQAQRAQQMMDFREKSLRERQKEFQSRMKRSKASLDFRRQNAQSMREVHHLSMLNQVNSAIDRNTKAAEFADEETKAKIMQHVAKLHKIAEKYEKMFLPEEGEEGGGANGGGESASAGETY